MNEQELRQCFFCVSGAKTVDYKNIEKMKKFLDFEGKILSRKKTSTCAFHQRKLARAVKRARQLGLLPFTTR